MTKKAWIIFAAMCVGLIGGLIFLQQRNQIDVSSVDTTKAQPASSESGDISEHVYGNSNSKVLLVEYADFQCPGCNSSYPVTKKVIEKYKDKIGFIFRNYPLTSAHPNALAAAAAAESAGLQGKYWEMHNSLFENRASWVELSGSTRTENFVKLASDIKGLNIEKFKADLENPNIRKKIDYDMALGKKDSVGGTPAMYINGKDVGSQKVLNGKLVSGTNTDTNASYVWANADNFEKFVIQPAMKSAGISY
jgi:Na+/H+ antiporter, nhaA family protein